jgi:hypothetical protein
VSDRKLPRGKTSVQRVVTRMRLVSCYLPLVRKVFLKVLASDTEHDMRRLGERLEKLDPRQWTEAVRDEIEQALRSCCRMSKHFGSIAAADFRHMRFPHEHAAEIDAEPKRWELEDEIAQMRRHKVPAPVREAKETVAKRWGHQSGDALRKALQPARLQRKKTGTKKPRKKSLT